MLTIQRAWKQGLKRGRPEYPTNGRMPSPYSLRLQDERITRRVYEDWNQLQTNGSEDPEDWSPVPYVLIIKGEIITLSDVERQAVIDLAAAED